MDSSERRRLSVREMQEESQRRARALLAGIYTDQGEESSREDLDLQATTEEARQDIWSDPHLSSLKQRIAEINQWRVQNWANYFYALSVMDRSKDQEKEQRRKKKLLFSLRVMQDGRHSFEDIVDAYLAYLQVNVVDPAMESALGILQKFALDACDEKILEDQLQFGAPWRHPPHTKDHQASLK